MADNTLVRLLDTRKVNWLFRTGKILILSFLIVFLVSDIAWAGKKKRLKHRHSLMIGAGFFGDASKFGYEGLCLDYQYDLRDNLSISVKPAIAFPDEDNSYYTQFFTGVNWRPFGGVLPRRKSKSFGTSPYLGLCFGLDYFWTDPVASNVETQHRFGLIPLIGMGYTLLTFSHFVFDVYGGLGLSWSLFGDYGDTFTAQQHIRVSFGMKF